MNSFVAKHRSEINGVLQCFDRIILRGHLPIAGVGYFCDLALLQADRSQYEGALGRLVELQARGPVVCRDLKGTRSRIG